jgi:hypothetical protein
LKELCSWQTIEGEKKLTATEAKQEGDKAGFKRRRAAECRAVYTVAALQTLQPEYDKSICRSNRRFFAVFFQQAAV